MPGHRHEAAERDCMNRPLECAEGGEAGQVWAINIDVRSQGRAVGIIRAGARRGAMQQTHCPQSPLPPGPTSQTGPATVLAAALSLTRGADHKLQHGCAKGPCDEPAQLAARGPLRTQEGGRARRAGEAVELAEGVGPPAVRGSGHGLSWEPGAARLRCRRGARSHPRPHVRRGGSPDARGDAAHQGREGVGNRARPVEDQVIANGSYVCLDLPQLVLRHSMDCLDKLASTQVCLGNLDDSVSPAYGPRKSIAPIHRRAAVAEPTHTAAKCGEGDDHWDAATQQGVIEADRCRSCVSRWARAEESPALLAARNALQHNAGVLVVPARVRPQENSL
mmetsp:Transcript_105592/g.315393  ORF Transcript_105592/g.315393 Transcript_105592/m.315393 type:complete len:335 (+) Transcript_105592:689-1693(+)